MTLMTRSCMNRRNVRTPRWKQMLHHLLVVPEAPLLVAITFLAWHLKFPPMLGLLATIIVLWFFVRTGLLLLAEQRLSSGDEQRARWLAQAALNMYPWSVDALLMRAQVYAYQGDHAAAETLLRRVAPFDVNRTAVEAAPMPSGMLQKAILKQQVDVPAFSGTSVISPALLHHHARFALHTEDDPVKAIDLLQHAGIENLPACASTPLLLLLADAYITHQQFADARMTLQHTEEQLSRCAQEQRAETLYYLGCLWRALGEDGDRYFRQSVELDPTGPYAHAAWCRAVKHE